LVNLKDIEIVVFDADNTLFKVVPGVAEIYRAELLKQGFDVQLQVLQHKLRESWQALEELYINKSNGFKCSQKQEKLFWYEFSTRVIGPFLTDLDHSKIYEDIYYAFALPGSRVLATKANDTLKVLNSRGYKLSVLSNHDQRIKMVISGMAIANLIEGVFFAVDIGFKKPAKQIFNFVAAHYQVEPRKILYIGDHIEYDYQAARAASWQALLYDPAGDHEGNPLVASIRSLSELTGLLHGIGV